MYPKVKVTSKQDGAVISVNGFDIVITVKLSQVSPPPTINIESVQLRLEEYLEDLDFREDEKGIIINLTKYIDREKFAVIASIVKELGGNYISAGRESRFLIPKTKS